MIHIFFSLHASCDSRANDHHDQESSTYIIDDMHVGEREGLITKELEEAARLESVRVRAHIYQTRSAIYQNQYIREP